MPVSPAVVVPVTIANGASLSGAAQVGAGTLVGIVLPTFTSAALTFQVSEDGSTWREALDAAAAAITISATTGDRFFQAPTTLAGAPWIKVRSGTSGSPVTQGADRVINLVVK